jgi:hypothetical protein
VDVTDETYGTTPLAWAMYGWSEDRTAPGGHYYEVVAMLVAAGAAVRPLWLESAKVQADPKMRAALTQSDEGG